MTRQHPIQAMVDGWNQASMRARAATQMTLGSLIARLEDMPKEAPCQRFGGAHSYRGYYSDLAFSHDAAMATAGDALTSCKECMGQMFEGYKGGEFWMHGGTPVWIANYGESGLCLMGIGNDGTLLTAQEEPTP